MKKLMFICMIAVVSTNIVCISNFEKSQNHYNSGCSLMSAKQYSQAINEFSIAISLDQNNPNLWDRRATAFFCVQNYASAITDYTKAINLAPNIGFYYMERALCYQAIGNIPAMMNDIVLAAKFGNPEAQQFMAMYLAKVNAEINASSEKTKKEIQKSIEDRFGYKPGTITW